MWPLRVPGESVFRNRQLMERPGRGGTKVLHARRELSRVCLPLFASFIYLFFNDFFSFAV